MVKKVLILGAAGRDFHDFNMLFRNNPDYKVVAFTANQIPFITDRKYPKELAGKLYSDGIKIFDESKLGDLIDYYKIDICIQAYSDLPYPEVMHKASIANAHGSDFWLVSPEHTMLKSTKPVIAVCAVRTGSGKSQTSRYIAKMIKRLGKKPVVIRHPMPYGNLKDQEVQRFATLEDLVRQKCTIEEREDYEPHIKEGTIVYSGVDYGKILKAVEKEADIIIWDGGNNDAPFVKPDLMITVADPLRVGNELSYYPGETVARMADVLVVNKVNSASKAELNQIKSNLKSINNKAVLIYAESKIKADPEGIIKGKRALVIEDGPTVTHGNMKFGAATVAARNYGAKEIIDARKFAVGTIKETYEKYNVEKILPAIGYSKLQIRELTTVINNAKCDIVISGTPTDLRKVIKVNKPIVQVTYELAPIGGRFDNIIRNFVKKW